MNKNLAFVFPGQGSQSQGMMSDLYGALPVVRDTFQEASDALGYDVWSLIENNPDDQLNQTQYTQPALLAASVAAWRAWQAQTDITPSFLAGHSLGEYTALVCAGAIAFSDGVKLVSARGKAMQEAVSEGEGALAAIIGLSDEAITTLCEDMAEGDVLSPANFNCPGQVVIAGTANAVVRVLSVAKERGAKLAKKLPVSVPSHCALMLPAVSALQPVLDAVTVTKPDIPVINNVDACIFEEPSAIRDALLRQLSSSVQWVKTIHFLQAQGVDTVCECGPGRVLTGINKRIDRSLTLTNFSDLDTLLTTIELL